MYGALSKLMAFLLAQLVNSLLANTGNPREMGSSPGPGRSPGEGTGNPFQYFLPGEFPWTEEPGGLRSVGPQRIQHAEHTHTLQGQAVEIPRLPFR